MPLGDESDVDGRCNRVGRSVHARHGLKPRGRTGSGREKLAGDGSNSPGPSLLTPEEPKQPSPDNGDVGCDSKEAGRQAGEDDDCG